MDINPNPIEFIDYVTPKDSEYLDIPLKLNLNIGIHMHQEENQLEKGNSTTDESVASETTIISSLFDGDLTCFHEVFDWLTLTEIGAVAATCKRLQAIAGDYYKNYLLATLKIKIKIYLKKLITLK